MLFITHTHIYSHTLSCLTKTLNLSTSFSVLWELFLFLQPSLTRWFILMSILISFVLSDLNRVLFCSSGHLVFTLGSSFWYLYTCKVKTSLLFTSWRLVTPFLNWKIIYYKPFIDGNTCQTFYSWVLSVVWFSIKVLIIYG